MNSFFRPSVLALDEMFGDLSPAQWAAIVIMVLAINTAIVWGLRSFEQGPASVSVLTDASKDACVKTYLAAWAEEARPAALAISDLRGMQEACKGDGEGKTIARQREVILSLTR